MNTNILNIDQKKFYQKNGYLVPSLKLETDFVEEMNIAVDKFLINNPDITIERAACPHLPGGISNSQLIDEELSNKFLQFGFNKKIIKVVSEIIGDDIILWSMHPMIKAAKTGKEIPWHQDGKYWPIEPLATVTVWIALGDVNKDNGCMQFIPGSHKNNLLPHKQKKKNDENYGSLDLHIDKNSFSEEYKTYCEIKKSEISIHDVFLLHKSDPNISNTERRALAIRYMPSSSYYNYKTPTRISATGFKNSFDRPIYLVSGKNQNKLNRIKKLMKI